MKLLVIGGTGVLSSAVVTEAIHQDIEVTIVNRGRNGRRVPNGTHQIKADYHDEVTMRTLLEGKHFDAVIDFLCYDKIQIEYSINLLHKIADQYVFISTTCVYNTEIPGVKNEDAEKVLHMWDYSINKWDCEVLLQKKAKELNFNYTIVRPCVTYDNTRIPYGIMPPYGYHWTFIARILNHKPILRWDGGETRWNMMRVEDFAVGVVGLLGNSSAFGEAFNLSGDDSYSWNDVLAAIEKSIGIAPVIFDISSEEYVQVYPNRKGEIIGRSLDAIVDNSKIKRLVPFYKSSYNIDDGINKTIQSYKENNYHKGIDWLYDADTDRIISNFCKKNGVKASLYNLHFVDYIGNATLFDRLTYWLEYHKDIFFCRAIIKFNNFLKRVLKK